MNSDDKVLGPTPERLKLADDLHEDFITDTGRRTKRMLDGSVLDLLLSRGAINADQYNAGQQFYNDWYLAGLAASGVIDPARDVVDNSSRIQESDVKIDAMTRWKNAVQHLGKVHSGVLIDVVLIGMTLEKFGFKRFQTSNTKLATLRAQTSLYNALLELDLYYYGRKSVRMASAHAPDYRPSIIQENEGS